MKTAIRTAAIFAFAALATTAWVPLAQAQTLRTEIEAIVKEYIASHPDEIGEVVKDYLGKHPEALQEAIIGMMKARRGGAQVGNQPAPLALLGADKAAAVKNNSDLLFNSKLQVTLGDVKGDVTLVEFFDYNCGYCRRALADTMALLKDDPKLKIVLKEFPILGPGSAEAARIGVAVRMQDPGGQKYLAYHEKLLGGRGPANRESALAAAREAGVDMERLDKDVASDEVGQTLDESVKLAHALGINGTPGYVVGDTVVPGAIGAVALKRKIQEARK